MGDPSDIPKEIQTLGEVIRYLRIEKGMTLRALAEAVGVSAPFLSDLEHGRRMTSRLDEMAKVLDIELAILEKYDNRITPELEDWITSCPGLAQLLREMKRSKKTVLDFRKMLGLEVE